MRHLYIGAEITRNSKTGCGIKLENLPRVDDSVPYRHRAFNPVQLIDNDVVAYFDIAEEI